MPRMTSTAIEELEALLVPTGGQPAGFLLEHRIPPVHLEPFWLFTGPQGCYHDQAGARLIPATAWLEYLDWLREGGGDPSKATSDTKYQWRGRSGRTA